MMYMKRVKTKTEKAAIKVGSTKIGIEIADTPFKKAKGLMFRESLGENEGMLFICKREHKPIIWMFGMRFSIDIVWIDKNRKVSDISENVRPCMLFKNAPICLLFCNTRVPKKKIKYVLEVNSGFVKRHGIKVGSKITFLP